MKKILLWVAISVLLSLGIWYFLKPSVYDIPVPEKPAVSGLMNRIYLADSAVFDYRLPEGSWDSVSTTEGLNADRKGLKKGILPLRLKPGALPLQMISLWKNGIAYRQVIERLPAAQTDSGLVIPYHGLTRVYESGDSNKYTGVFKENFEESSVMLRLEKKKPARIITLWENYAISGYTDGEGIKVRIPRCAFASEKSLLRIWVCDSSGSSQLCEVPLQKGMVMLRSDGEGEHNLMLRKNLNALMKQWSSLPSDPVWEARLQTWTSELMNKAELVPVLLYGDLRGYRVAPDCYALLCSYFGKKVVFVFNDGKSLVRVSIPMKGEIGNAMGGSRFNLVRNRLEFNLMPGQAEVLW